MSTAALDKKELLVAINDTAAQLTELLSGLDDAAVNKMPYADSWTAGQTVQHVTKAINGMNKGMQNKTKPVDRDPGERIPLLKDTFLDFSTKMQSPEFIVPENGPFEKETSLAEISKSFGEFSDSLNAADLNEVVEGMRIGPVSKLELAHFALYHTQRHVHQLKKIREAVVKV